MGNIYLLNRYTLFRKRLNQKFMSNIIIFVPRDEDNKMLVPRSPKVE